MSFLVSFMVFVIFVLIVGIGVYFYIQMQNNKPLCTSYYIDTNDNKQMITRVPMIFTRIKELVYCSDNINSEKTLEFQGKNDLTNEPISETIKIINTPNIQVLKLKFGAQTFSGTLNLT